MWILVNTTNYKFWVKNGRLRTKCEFWPAWKDCGVKAYEVGGRAPPGRYLFIHNQIYIKTQFVSYKYNEYIDTQIYECEIYQLYIWWINLHGWIYSQTDSIKKLFRYTYIWWSSQTSLTLLQTLLVMGLWGRCDLRFKI